MTAISAPEEVYNHELRQYNEQRSQYEKAKSIATVETREINLEKNEEDPVSIHWHTGVAARFPWLGFAAILTMLTCIAFSIIILQTSDGKVKEKWPVELRAKWFHDNWKEKAQLTPSVALAIVNTVSNVSLAIAIGQGVAIAWWRKALKGATVKDLHQSWSFSSSVLELLTAGKAFNLVALAALTAKMALVDNLLLQKAAGTSPNFYPQDRIPVRVPSWQAQFPPNYVGVFNERGTIGSFTKNFSNILHDYATDTDFVDAINIEPALFNSCKGTCYGSVPGFGFSIHCVDDDPLPIYIVNADVARNYTLSASNPKGYPDMTFPTLDGASPDSPSLLSFDATDGIAIPNTRTKELSGITFGVSWAELVSANGDPSDVNAEICSFKQVSRTCQLRPALLNYTVEIVNSGPYTSQVSSKSTNGLRVTPIFISPDNLTDVTSTPTDPLQGGQMAEWNIRVIKEFDYDPQYESNILGWTQMMNGMFSGDVSLGYLNGSGFLATGDGLSASAIGNWWTSLNDGRTNPNSCVLSTTDPTEYILTQLNHITFRASVYAGEHSWFTDMYDSDFLHRIEPKFDNFVNNVTLTLPYVANILVAQFSPTLQYDTTKAFMYGAVVTMFFCILCVLPSYWGFWELGRKVTLGPMEIASAFQAPVLDHPSVSRTGGEVEILLKEVGERKVRYGEVEGSGKLVVAEPAEVKKLTLPSAHWRGGRDLDG